MAEFPVSSLSTPLRWIPLRSGPVYNPPTHPSTNIYTFLIPILEGRDDTSLWECLLALNRRAASKFPDGELNLLKNRPVLHALISILQDCIPCISADGSVEAPLGDMPSEEWSRNDAFTLAATAQRLPESVDSLVNSAWSHTEAASDDTDARILPRLGHAPSSFTEESKGGEPDHLRPPVAIVLSSLPSPSGAPLSSAATHVQKAAVAYVLTTISSLLSQPAPFCTDCAQALSLDTDALCAIMAYTTVPANFLGTPAKKLGAASTPAFVQDVSCDALGILAAICAQIDLTGAAYTKTILASLMVTNAPLPAGFSRPAIGGIPKDSITAMATLGTASQRCYAAVAKGLITSLSQRISTRVPVTHALLALQAICGLCSNQTNAELLDRLFDSRLVDQLVNWIQDLPPLAERADDESLLSSWTSFVVTVPGTNEHTAAQKVPTMFGARSFGKGTARTWNSVLTYEAVRSRELRQRRDEMRAQYPRAKRQRTASDGDSIETQGTVEPAEALDRNTLLRLRDMSVAAVAALCSLKMSHFVHRFLAVEEFLDRLAAILASPFGSSSAHILALEAFNHIATKLPSMELLQAKIPNLLRALDLIPKRASNIRKLLHRLDPVEYPPVAEEASGAQMAHDSIAAATSSHGINAEHGHEGPQDNDADRNAPDDEKAHNEDRETASKDEG